MSNDYAFTLTSGDQVMPPTYLPELLLDLPHDSPPEQMLELLKKIPENLVEAGDSYNLPFSNVRCE